jgi:hypothetical protein
MNSDTYEFAKSSHPQSVSQYTSYTDKQWNYVPDINSGVYSNNSGLTLVTWDLTSIYNSAGLSDATDLFLAVPIVMCATVSAAGVTVAPSTMAAYSLCSLKSNYQNLIHQIEVTSNGRQVQEMQPFVNVYQNFKLLSSMSATDLQGIGPSLNINGTLDNEKSVSYNTTANVTGGCTENTSYSLFAVWPHMHQLGTHMKVTQRRGAAARRVAGKLATLAARLQRTTAEYVAVATMMPRLPTASVAAAMLGPQVLLVALLRWATA